MTIEQIYSNLCYYDIRNTDSNFEIEEIDNIEYGKSSCFCDNCFYERTKLAEYILEILKNEK